MTKWVLRICEHKRGRNVWDCDIVISCLQTSSEYLCIIQDDLITAMSSYKCLLLSWNICFEFQWICLPQVLQNTQSEQALPIAALLSVPAQPPRTTCVVLEKNSTTNYSKNLWYIQTTGMMCRFSHSGIDVEKKSPWGFLRKGTFPHYQRLENLFPVANNGFWRRVIVFKSGHSFLFRAPGVPQLRVRKRPLWKVKVGFSSLISRIFFSKPVLESSHETGGFDVS